MNQQLSFIDMLSVFCFCLTMETIDDNRILEEHLKKQDDRIDKILEVLENDSRRKY